MERSSGKRANDGLVVSRKASNLVVRDTGCASNRNQNAKCCNRLGCSARPTPTKDPQIAPPVTSRVRGQSVRTSSSKDVVGGSRISSAITNQRKSSSVLPRRQSSPLGTDSSGVSSSREGSEVSDFFSPPGKILRSSQVDSRKPGSTQSPRVKVGSSTAASSSNSDKNIHRRSTACHKDSTVASSPSTGSQKCSSQAASAVTNRLGMKKHGCESVSNAIPACSSSSSRGKNMSATVNAERVISSDIRGKKVIGSFSERQNSNTSHRFSLADSRPTRHMPPHRVSLPAPVGKKRTINQQVRPRQTAWRSGKSASLRDSPSRIARMSQSDVSIDPSSSNNFSSEPYLSHAISVRQPLRSNESIYGAGLASPGLMAVEGIEQDEELTEEQLLLLEADFLYDLTYDQHRDMRLDIDNMSYEQLLDLEERMGSVSTALTEEALSKCLQTSIYHSTDAAVSCTDDKDDIKCCICQEEYVGGDEVGRLQCEHRYHVACVRQWLSLKNWCPICKEPAASGPPSFSP